MHLYWQNTQCSFKYFEQCICSFYPGDDEDTESLDEFLEPVKLDRSRSNTPVHSGIVHRFR